MCRIKTKDAFLNFSIMYTACSACKKQRLICKEEKGSRGYETPCSEWAPHNSWLQARALPAFQTGRTTHALLGIQARGACCSHSLNEDMRRQRNWHLTMKQREIYVTQPSAMLQTCAKTIMSVCGGESR